MRLELFLLSLAGLGLVAGGILHPHVSGDVPAQIELYRSHPVWAPSHWLLTLAQIGGFAALALVLQRLPGEANARLRAGALLAMLGLAMGVLGTLSASTALVEAARADDAGLFTALGAFTMGLGWLCVVTAAAGATLAGSCLVRAEPGGRGRALGWAALVGSSVVLVAALALGPSHRWTHPYLLRFGAIGFGVLLLLASGAWRRSARRGGERPRMFR